MMSATGREASSTTASCSPPRWLPSCPSPPPFRPSHRARFVVREFADQLQHRYDPMTLEKQSDNSSRQIRLASAAMTVRSAEALIARGARRGDELPSVRRRTPPAQLDDRDRPRRRDVPARHRRGVRGGGSEFPFPEQSAAAARRDVNTIACHTVFDLDQRYRSMGRSLVGLPSGSLWH